MDRLEKFIDTNKSAFDSEEPSVDLWAKILEQQENESDDKQPSKGRIIKLNWYKISTRVAAAVVVFFVSYYIHHWINTDKMVEPKEVISEVVTTNAVKPQEKESEVSELLEAEEYYSMEVSNKINEFNKYESAYPELVSDVKKDITELDLVYQDLKKDLKENYQNTEVIEAMIQNYRLKLEILEDMLQHLEHMSKEDKTNTQEKNVHI